MSFGKRLRNLRRQKGWTQKELAAQLHITSQAVSKWEQDVSEPDVRKLRTLSELFGVKVDQLVGNPSPMHEDRPIVLFSGYTSKKVKARYGILTLFSSFLLLAFMILVIYTYWLDGLTWHFPLGFLLAAAVDLALLWKVDQEKEEIARCPTDTSGSD